jgi:hypothetical protein
VFGMCGFDVWEWKSAALRNATIYDDGRFVVSTIL